ncbi:MAG: polyphosphate polymerase domain-containing protein [Planctomycetes bacterium]|nr:polyphosphate polymerase domain-containing protein [Planctomycetota bacterium]
MTAEPKTRLHFSRFEFKYVLDARLREDVEAELQHFVELDPWVAGQPENRYLVRSLYFDDRELTAFHDKVDGMLTRTKFRLRTYSRDVDAPAPWFLEIKGRHNNLVLKHRTPVSGEFDRRASGHELSRLLLRHADAGPLRSEFEFQLFRRQIEPIVLIDYVRRPYISKFDPEFRLTFDAGLTATETDTVFPDQTARRRDVMCGYTVMEVKFRHHVPSWFHRILQAYELRRRSVSKICAGTEALGLARDPS